MKDMVIADIGCGTGLLLDSFAEKGIFRKFLAVEPCKLMLDQVKDGDTPIEKFCMDGEQFSKLKCIMYDSSIMFGILHHIPQRCLLEFLRGVFTQTNPGGTVLVITYSPTLPFPLWPEHVEAATACFPSWDNLQETLRQAGFDDVTCLKKSYGDVVITRDSWLQMVRGRFISTLSTFSDEEIEEGPDPVVFEEYQYFVKGRKIAA
jgi:SAM-dependent methyltransferase